jgi:ABC-2 type transport system ATP-binding protein
VNDLLGSHLRLSGVRRDPGSLPADWVVVEETHTDKQSTLLVYTDGAILDPSWSVKPVTLDDLILAYMSQGRSLRPNQGRELGVLR